MKQEFYSKDLERSDLNSSDTMNDIAYGGK